MGRTRLQIDTEHATKLIRGESIAVKVPRDTDVLEIRLAKPYDGDSFAKLVDVFFNGRSA